MKTLTKLLSTVAVAATISMVASAASATVHIGNWTGDPTTSITVTFNDEGIGSAQTPLTEFFNDDPSSIFFGQSMGFASHTVNVVGDTATFTDVFTFNLPPGFLGGGGTSHHSTAGTISQQNHVNLDFSGVTFQGVPVTFHNGTVDDSTRTFHFDDVILTDQTLTVSGSGGTGASYAGTLTFTPLAVPEPATWGLMMVGFGGLGAMLRSNRCRALALA